MSKHTPGPWQIQKLVGKDGTLFVGTDEKGFFTCARVSGSDIGNINGNAHLIAAAPELFEALHIAFRRLESYGPGDNDWILDKCLKAIAKAEGRDK
jgi:hypothetical protein